MNAKSAFLRRLLQGNAVFSGASRTIFILVAKPLSALIGLSVPAILVGIGTSLLVFTAALFFNSQRETINQMEAFTAVILDLGWVVGSTVVIFAGLLNTTGNWAVAIVADVVRLFAVLQACGLRKLRQKSFS